MLTYTTLLPILALVACNISLTSALPNGTTGTCKVRKHRSTSSAIAAVQTTSVGISVAGGASSVISSSTIVAVSTSSTVQADSTAVSDSAGVASTVSTSTIATSVIQETTSATAPQASTTAPQASTTSESTVQVAAGSTSALTVPSPVSSAPPGTIKTGSDVANQLVKLHTDFRAQYGAGPVTWDDELAEFAQQAANACVYAHTGGPYGENIAATVSNGTDNPEVVNGGFEGWANEAQYYDWNKPGYNAPAPRNSGHFTAVVWKETTLIGCGVGSCKDGTVFSDWGHNSSLLFCEYYKPGNVYLASDDMVVDANQFFKTNVLPKGTKVT